MRVTEHAGETHGFCNAHMSRVKTFKRMTRFRPATFNRTERSSADPSTATNIETHGRNFVFMANRQLTLGQGGGGGAEPVRKLREQVCISVSSLYA